MFRSLHMKLVLIMVLLIVSLMTVVGSFLINSVVGFYLDDFYTQMQTVFAGEQFARDLREETDAERRGETTAPQQLDQMLATYVGVLGVDSRSRNYYILDGTYGTFLAGSDDQKGPKLAITPNISAALLGKNGDKSDVSASYMDLAIPIERGGNRYIIYLYDNRQTVQNLNTELFSLILEALVFGLVISVLLSFLLSKTMITPIERLTAGAKRVASGDFSSKIEVGSKDEIGILTTNFNSMARQLRDTIEQVENERNKLGTLFLHMTDGVVAFNRSGAVIHSNPAAEEMLARTIDGSTHYDDLFSDIASLYEVLSVEQPGYLEGERELDGRNLELLLAPFDRESQGGILVVIHDVTTQRKTEELRREFVANVSHELRTPLTNIRSYTETLAESNDDLTPEQRQNFLGVILSESDRMTHIVQDLLTLSRFDSGRNELALAPFSFADAVHDIYSAVLLEAQKHDHTLTLDLAKKIPDVMGDRERIMQVMMNIVSNSIKYTPDGGHIDITAGRAGDIVFFQVTDDGIGIPDADRSRIFERFYRVDKARSRAAGGTGLGLSIIDSIVNLHR
ncbi:MAG: histidine kinase dimerization/phospho-acceptor domain-containing protein, partial [Oscillospiraceae bacterium]